MPCEICSGSCSLCPWCGEEQCPHLHDYDNDNDKRYWVYATDRKESCHVLQANLNSKKEVIDFVRKLANKNWGKKYKRVENIDGRVIKRNSLYKSEASEVPWVEITITEGGKYLWGTSINLFINTEDKTIWYGNIWKTRFYAWVDKGEEVHVETVKPWDGKLNFINFKELPWYPTPEEWEERAKQSDDV